MNNPRHPFYVAATGAAFAAGLLIRFAALTRVPLSDAEASLALQAFDLARGQMPATVTQPGYLSLTTLVFWLFGSSGFLARFWPALAGSLLVLAPLLYRRFFGPVSMLILTWLLAIDPGLVAASRTASGTIFAVAFSLLAVGFYFERRSALAGICAALAVMGGPLFWPGLVIMAVVLLRASGWRINNRSDEDQKAADDRIDPDVRPRFNLRSALVALLLTLLLVGTIFFRYPAILGGIPSSLVAYLRGFGTASGVPVWMMLTALLVYEIFVVLGGLITLINDGIRRGLGVLGLMSLVALALVLIYPSRQVSDLVWVTVPLIGLTALLLERWLLPEEISIAPVVAETLLTVILLVFAWFNLTALANPVQDDPSLRLAAMWSAIGLLAITSILMVWGWSLVSMRTGLTYGLTALLFLFTLSSAVNAGGLGRNPQVEMWQGSQVVADEDLIRQTVGDLALWTKGDRDIIDVSVVGMNSPALHWALRNVQQLSFVDYLPQDTQPSIVITPEQQTISIANTYRGQDFVWTRRPAWSAFLEAEWLRWLAERDAVTEKTNLILWARTDLFPGGAAQPAQANP